MFSSSNPSFPVGKRSLVSLVARWLGDVFLSTTLPSSSSNFSAATNTSTTTTPSSSPLISNNYTNNYNNITTTTTPFTPPTPFSFTSNSDPLHMLQYSNFTEGPRSYSGIYGNYFIGLGVAVILSLLWAFFYVWRRNAKLSSLVPLWIVYVSFGDFISDFTFISQMPRDPPVIETLRISSIAFIMSASFLNVAVMGAYVAYIVLKGGAVYAPFVRWLHVHKAIFAALLFLSLTSSKMLTLIHSGLFEINMFSAPLPMAAMEILDLLGIITVVVEDVPQAIINIYISQSTNTWDSVSYTAVFFSCLSVAVSVGCRGIVYLYLTDKDRSEDNDAVLPEHLKGERAFRKGSINHVRHMFEGGGTLDASKMTNRRWSVKGTTMPEVINALRQIGTRGPKDAAAAVDHEYHPMAVHNVYAVVSMPLKVTAGMHTEPGKTPEGGNMMDALAAAYEMAGDSPDYNMQTTTTATGMMIKSGTGGGGGGGGEGKNIRAINGGQNIPDSPQHTEVLSSTTMMAARSPERSTGGGIGDRSSSSSSEVPLGSPAETSFSTHHHHHHDNNNNNNNTVISHNPFSQYQHQHNNNNNARRNNRTLSGNDEYDDKQEEEEEAAHGRINSNSNNTILPPPPPFPFSAHVPPPGLPSFHSPPLPPHHLSSTSSSSSSFQLPPPMPAATALGTVTSASFSSLERNTSTGSTGSEPSSSSSAAAGTAVMPQYTSIRPPGLPSAAATVVLNPFAKAVASGTRSQQQQQQLPGETTTTISATNNNNNTSSIYSPSLTATSTTSSVANGASTIRPIPNVAAQYQSHVLDRGRGRSNSGSNGGSVVDGGGNGYYSNYNNNTTYTGVGNSVYSSNNNNTGGGGGSGYVSSASPPAPASPLALPSAYNTNNGGNNSSNNNTDDESSLSPSYITTTAGTTSSRLGMPPPMSPSSHQPDRGTRVANINALQNARTTAAAATTRDAILGAAQTGGNVSNRGFFTTRTTSNTGGK